MDPNQISPNISDQQFQQPSTSQTPKSTPKFIFILGGLVILVVFSTGGLFLGKYIYTPKPSLIIPPTLTPTLTIAPSITSINESNSESSQSATVNWKTYSNKKYLISFKYPDDYFKYISPSEDTVYLAPKAGNGEAYGSPMGLEQKDVWLSLSVTPIDADISLEQFIDLPEMSDYKNTKKQKITIANKMAYKVTFDKPSGPQGVVYYEGLVENGKSIYRIQLSSFTTESLITKQIIFDQILSTFKFLDATKSTLEICGNEKFGYKIGGYDECLDFNVLYPASNIMDAPITITDKNWKEITQCGGMPGPNGNNSCPDKYASRSGCKKMICPINN